MECSLTSFRTLRNICKCICFGIIFMWIVIGSYKHQHYDEEIMFNKREQELHQGGIPGTRKLLESSLSDMYRVENYTIDVNDECSQLHYLPKHDQELLCEFVTKVEACGAGGFIPYFKFVYCWMPLNLIPLSMVLLFLWLLYLFVFLGTTAEEYFCPALTVISQVLRLSQNIAVSIYHGVTLLAFGNGAPDIFSALAAINQPDIKRASLAFGALFGAGMFVSCIVVGAVIVSKPFTLTRRPFMRDLIFYLAACYWTFFLLWKNSINIWMSVGFIILYLFYVTVVIFGRVVYQKWKRKRSSVRTGDIPRPPQKQIGEEMDSSSVHQTAALPSNGFHSNNNLAVPKQHVTFGNGFIPRPHVTNDKHEDHLNNSGEIMDPSIIDSDVEERTVQDKRTTIIVEIHDHDGDNNSRCSTPNQRCASRASQIVYGVVNEEEVIDKEQQGTTKQLTVSTEVHPVHPRHEPVRNAVTPSPKKLRKTISGALDITEDVGLTAIGTPNLSKLWHHAYRRELVHENTSRSSSPYLRHSPISRNKSPVGPLVKSHSVSYQKTQSDDEFSSGKENEEDSLLVESEELIIRKKKIIHPFIKLLLVFWPFGETFQALRIWGKIYEIVKYPANCLLTLTVPVIDGEEELDNWNRWLNIIQCLLAPLFICFTINVGLILIGGVVPVSAIVLLGGVSLAVFIACTSQNHEQPKYHCVFAWLGFGVAVVWIYSIANEIVSVLQVFGVVVNISDGILGITLLAWGNSIGDAVANITMARQGFPRMAIGACYGGPLLNMLLGIGLAATVKSVQQSSLSFPLYFTQVQMFAALSLLFSLSLSLVITSFLKFKMRRSYGVLLFIMYLFFLLTVILAEVKVFDIKIDNVLSPL